MILAEGLTVDITISSKKTDYDEEKGTAMFNLGVESIGKNNWCLQAIGVSLGKMLKYMALLPINRYNVQRNEKTHV